MIRETTVTETSTEQILGMEPQIGFDLASISLASPEEIRSWSQGEVKNL